jgi:hypothetical protein
MSTSCLISTNVSLGLNDHNTSLITVNKRYYNIVYLRVYSVLPTLDAASMLGNIHTLNHIKQVTICINPPITAGNDPGRRVTSVLLTHTLLYY